MLADKGAHVFDRLLTPAEAEYCRSRPDPATHVAVRLAAKEAVYKALQGSEAARGNGWRGNEGGPAPPRPPRVSLPRVAAGPGRPPRGGPGAPVPSPYPQAGPAPGRVR